MIRRLAGFTLLEIMVVLIIISSILAIAIPRVNDLFEVNLKSSIRKLGGAIQFCFNESVIRQTPMRLNFNFETNEYFLSYLNVSGSTGEFIEMPSDLVPRQQLPDGVFIKDVVTTHSLEKKTEGEEFINFYPTGYVEPAVIHIGARDGRIWTAQVKPLTGKINVFDREVDFVDLNPPTGTNRSSSSSGGLSSSGGIKR